MRAWSARRPSVASWNSRADMRAEPAILDGNPDFYERLGSENEASSQAWTEYYTGRGPRPGDKHLP
jgi:hypothetical protein